MKLIIFCAIMLLASAQISFNAANCGLTTAGVVLGAPGATQCALCNSPATNPAFSVQTIQPQGIQVCVCRDPNSLLQVNLNAMTISCVPQPTTTATATAIVTIPATASPTSVPSVPSSGNGNGNTTIIINDINSQQQAAISKSNANANAGKSSNKPSSKKRIIHHHRSKHHRKY